MKVAQSKELNPIGWGSGASFLDQSQSEKGTRKHLNIAGLL